MITVYSVIKETKHEFNRGDLLTIGGWVKNAYFEKFGAYPEKTDQDEGDGVFRVFIYPDDFRAAIYAKIKYYFLRKEKQLQRALDIAFNTAKIVNDVRSEFKKNKKVFDESAMDLMSKGESALHFKKKRKRVIVKKVK